MRIGILTHNYPQTSGQRKDAGTFIYDFAEELSGRGHKIYVFSPKFIGKKEAYKKVPVEWFNWSGGDKKLANINLKSSSGLFSIFSLLWNGQNQSIQFAKDHNLDFCLAFWSFPSGLFAWWIHKRLKIPYGIMTMGSDIFVYGKNPLLNFLNTYLLRRADIIFGDGKKISEVTARLAKKECTYIPIITAISFNNVKPLKRSKNTFNFLYVGRLESVKGPDLLIEAVKILSQTNPNFKVNIVGDGSMLEDLQEKVRKYNLGDKVTLLGNISDKKRLAAFYLSADCLIVPSRSESLSMVIPEAIKADLPVIASNVGDMGEFVRKNKIGYIFPSQKTNILASKMLLAMKEGHNFKKRRKENLRKLSAIFSIENCVDIFLKQLKLINKE